MADSNSATPSPPAVIGRKSDKISLIQNQINENTAILVDTMNQVVLRDEKLEHLEKQADELKSTSHFFERHAEKLKRKWCCKNAKMTLILVSVVTLFLLILILSLVCKSGNC